MPLLVRILAQALLALAKSKALRKAIPKDAIYKWTKTKVMDSVKYLLKNGSKLIKASKILTILSGVFALLGPVMGWPSFWNFLQWGYYKTFENITEEDLAAMSPEERENIKKIEEFWRNEIDNTEKKLIEDGVDPSTLKKDWADFEEEQPEDARTDGGQSTSQYPPTKGYDLEKYNQTGNTTYSGTDMLCSINIPGKGSIVFAELASLSYSVFREKVPVRALGRVSMKGYTRGMRTITGVMSFTMFDESIVYRCMEEIKAQGYRMLFDEMPTFDITITFANEYGSMSTMTLYEVTTYTEGTAMGIDQISTQNVYEFYARDLSPLTRQTERNNPYSVTNPQGTKPPVSASKLNNEYIPYSSKIDKLPVQMMESEPLKKPQTNSLPTPGKPLS